MCNFFSFVQTEDGAFHYLDELWRKDATESGDSHSLICKVFKLREDNVNKFEYSNGEIIEDHKSFNYHVEDVQHFIDKLIESGKFHRICLAAVKQYGYTLKYVKEQTPEICLAAVKQNGYALKYVNKQTPEICLAAVKQNGLALQHVKKQTLEICLVAIKQNIRATYHIKDK